MSGMQEKETRKIEVNYNYIYQTVLRDLIATLKDKRAQLLQVEFPLLGQFDLVIEIVELIEIMTYSAEQLLLQNEDLKDKYKQAKVKYDLDFEGDKVLDWLFKFPRKKGDANE